MTASTGIALATLTILVGAGCATDEAIEDEPSSETEQALNSFGIWSWGCASGPCALDLGLVTPSPPNPPRVCFLAGVWGNLQHAGIPSQVQVLPSGGHWGLQITPNGHPLGGTAVCIPGTVAATGTWHSGTASVNLGAGNPTRRCFLSGVLNTNGFTAASDFVQVQNSHGSWFLGGNQPGKDTTAFAVCTDVPSATADYGLVAGDGASFLQQTVQGNDPFGWACGIRKLGGHFTNSDYNDGVWIDYDNGNNGSGARWELNAVNGKQVATYCVK